MTASPVGLVEEYRRTARLLRSIWARRHDGGRNATGTCRRAVAHLSRLGEVHRALREQGDDRLADLLAEEYALSVRVDQARREGRERTEDARRLRFVRHDLRLLLRST